MHKDIETKPSQRVAMRLKAKRFMRKLRPETVWWMVGGYAPPAPFNVKVQTLFRNALPNSDWIETGTYLAETTVALAKQFSKNQVLSIEPEPQIHSFVTQEFSNYKNIVFLHGSSENKFEEAILRLNQNLNFWLDGHYSGDVTFRGEIESPILYELEMIEKHLIRMANFCVFIDDFRLFGESSGYPPKIVIIEWANRLHLDWRIENDIFIAKLISPVSKI